MPADADSLAALGELASTPGRPDPGSVDDQVTVAVPVDRPRRPRPSMPSVLASMPVLRSPSSVPALAAVRSLPRRTQLGALAVCSVAAGLLAGLVVPVASAAPAPSAAAASQPQAQTRTAARAKPAAAKPAVAKPAQARPVAAKPAKARPAAAKPAKATTTTAVATSARTTASTARTSSTAAASIAAALPALGAVPSVDWSVASGSTTTARPSRAAAATVAVVREAAPTRPSAATIAAARAYKPTRKLPADSGVGRRIVYSQHRGHVWVVGADGRVVRDYPVTGRIGRPSPGSYRVFSKSPTAVEPDGQGALRPHGALRPRNHRRSHRVPHHPAVVRRSSHPAGRPARPDDRRRRLRAAVEGRCALALPLGIGRRPGRRARLDLRIGSRPAQLPSSHVVPGCPPALQ